MNYDDFLATKTPADPPSGLRAIPPLHSALKPFQAALTNWTLRRGRAAMFAGTGLGKTLMQLVYARVVADEEQAPILIHAPLAVANQTTKAIGLLHKQVVKDSALSRMGIGDKIVTLRKPGENDEPVAGIFEEYYGDDLTDADLSAEARRSIDSSGSRTLAQHKSILIWQRYAEPVWLDIAQSDTLSFRMARDEQDERHISPLQLTPVRRCIDLWTNPGDVVFSPFAGIGTAGYVALEMGRRFIGAELKPSYYRQAVVNLRVAESERQTEGLFDNLAAEG